ncbi:MAG: hypothetical protein ACFFDW_05705 [Candidatus Thorarchaeota archaeon]
MKKDNSNKLLEQSQEEQEELHELGQEIEEIDESNVHLDIMKCYWCNITEDDSSSLKRAEIQLGEQINYFYTCSKEHENRVVKFYNYSSKTKLLYYFFILIAPIILLVLTAIFWNFVFVYPIFGSIGIGLIILPLFSNRTIEGLGLRNTLIIGRILGVVLVVIGFTLFAINGYKIFLPS